MGVVLRSSLGNISYKQTMLCWTFGHSGENYTWTREQHRCSTPKGVLAGILTKLLQKICKGCQFIFSVWNTPNQTSLVPESWYWKFHWKQKTSVLLRYFILYCTGRAIFKLSHLLGKFSGFSFFDLGELGLRLVPHNSTTPVSPQLQRKKYACYIFVSRSLCQITLWGKPHTLILLKFVLYASLGGNS